MWDSTWCRGQARRQPAFFQQFTGRPAGTRPCRRGVRGYNGFPAHAGIDLDEMVNKKAYDALPRTIYLMVPTIYKPGPDVAELLAYITHDAKDRETADRVEWTEAVNIPVDDGPTCGRIMARNVRDADALKAANGISTRGRKLKKPYEHITACGKSR